MRNWTKCLRYLVLFMVACGMSMSVSSCAITAATSTLGSKISVEELENYRQNVLKSKTSIVKTCGCSTGMMQGLFGDRYAIDLPNAYQRAATEYDNLCKTFPGNNYDENFRLCKLIGLKVNMEYTGAKYAKDQFVEMLPGILKFFQGF